MIKHKRILTKAKDKEPAVLKTAIDELNNETSLEIVSITSSSHDEHITIDIFYSAFDESDYTLEDDES